jgi:hypothetical protein
MPSLRHPTWATLSAQVPRVPPSVLQALLQQSPALKQTSPICSQNDEAAQMWLSHSDEQHSELSRQLLPSVLQVALSGVQVPLHEPLQHCALVVHDCESEVHAGMVQLPPSHTLPTAVPPPVAEPPPTADPPPTAEPPPAAEPPPTAAPPPTDAPPPTAEPPPVPLGQPVHEPNPLPSDLQTCAPETLLPGHAHEDCWPGVQTLAGLLLHAASAAIVKNPASRFAFIHSP